MEEVRLGLRVVRGPDWDWGERDGGEGHVGTVIVVDAVVSNVQGRSVVVQWDCGEKCRHMCGVDGKYDLRVLDSAPAGRLTDHPHHLACAWCDAMPLAGMVWSCTRCRAYYLCTPCYMADKHSLDHEFNLFSSSTDESKRIRIAPRFISPRLPFKGIYPEAKVVRGCHWRWEDQDGGCGNIGHVFRIFGWKDESQRSVAEVMWNGGTQKYNYSTSHLGMVDLKCVTASCGGYYYPSHLPVLGVAGPFDKTHTCAGDPVMVQVDPDLFRLAQEDHGGWSDTMAEYIGRVGVVTTISDKDDAVVQYLNRKILHLNKDILIKVDVHVFACGDLVRVKEDMVEVHALQEGHGEWNDDMALTLGQVGVVKFVFPDSDLRVSVNGKSWTMNSQCVVPMAGVSHAELEGHVEDVVVEREEIKQIRLLLEANLPEVVPVAAAVEDAASIREHLTRNPFDVDYKRDDKGALHIAVMRGSLPVLKTLLNFCPDVNLMNEDGSTALHLCSQFSNPTAARLLVDHGADVNIINYKGQTAIEMASIYGEEKVLRVLVGAPSAKVDILDIEGKTPLYRSLIFHHRGCVRTLLEHGANPTAGDPDMTPLAVGCGFLGGVEELFRFYPRCVNHKKADGFTPLLMAAVNNHSDVVAYIASQPSCDINILNQKHHTPLHIAVVKGHVGVVEKLVGYGADLDIAGPDGSTPLHLTLGMDNMEQPSARTPAIKKFQDEVEAVHGKHVLSSNWIVGLFLVANGADLHIKNLHGKSAMSHQPRDSASLLVSYMDRRNHFHGSYRDLAQPFTEPPRPMQLIGVPAVTNGQGSTATSKEDNSNDPELKSNGNTRVIRKEETNDCHGDDDTGDHKHIADKDNDLEKELAIKNNFEEESTKKEAFRCVLCEEAMGDIKLVPCQHVMCQECVTNTPNVKKCLQCKSAVTSLVKACVMCQQEQPNCVMDRCGHTYCSGCKAGLEYCQACRQLHEEEEEKDA